MPLHRPWLDFPSVNRRLKGDLLVSRPRDRRRVPDDGTRDLTPGRVKTVSFSRPPEAPASAPSGTAAAPLAPKPPQALAVMPAPGRSEAEVTTAALTPKPKDAAAPAKAGDETANKPATYALASLSPAATRRRPPLRRCSIRSTSRMRRCGWDGSISATIPAATRSAPSSPGRWTRNC